MSILIEDCCTQAFQNVDINQETAGEFSVVDYVLTLQDNYSLQTYFHLSHVLAGFLSCSFDGRKFSAFGCRDSR